MAGVADYDPSFVGVSGSTDWMNAAQSTGVHKFTI